MCGRVFQTMNTNQLLRLAGTNLIRNGERFGVNHNVCPTSNLPAIRYHAAPEHNYREVDMMKWGYQTDFQFIINARGEELTEKRTFIPMLNHNRVVVMVSGFFEWDEKKEKKQPFVFKPKATDLNNQEDKPPVFYIAALTGKDDTVILLTREATKEINVVHHRMPIFLEENEIDKWLNSDKYKFNQIFDKEILDGSKSKWSNVDFYPIGPYVNNIKNKTDQCLMSLDDHMKKLDSVGIKKFFQAKPKEKTASKEENKEETKESIKTVAIKENAKDIGNEKVPTPNGESEQAIVIKLSSSTPLGNKDALKPDNETSSLKRKRESITKSSKSNDISHTLKKVKLNDEEKQKKLSVKKVSLDKAMNLAYPTK